MIRSLFGKRLFAASIPHFWRSASVQLILQDPLMGMMCFSTEATSSAMESAPVVHKRGIDLMSSSFLDFRKENTAYVNKTSAIVDVLAAPHLSRRAFFSRPRRFGKSLTIEVMAEMLAAGELPNGVQRWPGFVPVDVEALFGGLAVYDRIMKKDPLARSVMEKPYFVIELGLGGAQTGTKLKPCIIWELAGIAGTAFGPQLEADVRSCSTPASALEELIAAVPKQVPIAVLVDEYDMAIIRDVTKQRWSAAEEGVDALRSLMMASKAPDLNHRIQRFIITGVAGLVRTLHSSGANNFIDLTGHPITSRMLGFTEDEIRTVFPSELEALGKDDATVSLAKMPAGTAAQDVAMTVLRDLYDGYCFDGVTTCFNPTPVLSALAAGSVTDMEMEGVSSFEWLGMPASHVLQHLPTDPVSAKVTSFDIVSLQHQKVDATAMLLQTGLLTRVPSKPAATTAVAPDGAATAAAPSAVAAAPNASSSATVLLRPPNLYARNSLLRLIECILSD